MSKDTFWLLIDQAKEHWGYDPDEASYWLMGQLVSMGPEQAKTFDTIARVYMDLAYQYGLWSAALVIDRGRTSDDGFIDFRQWLVGQGRSVYFAALKEPDSLADAPSYQDWEFVSLPLMGGYAYEELTGRDVFLDFDSAQYRALEAELKKDVVYGDGIGYPYDWLDVPAYLPKLCAKYFPPEQLIAQAKFHHPSWNLTNPDIQAARRDAKKSEKVTGHNSRRRNQGER